jgi:peptide/nickel transport system substrate-binding protein
MKNITRILLALVLALTLVVPAFAEEAAAPVAEKGTIVYGASTEIGGDFAPGAWYTNNATDKMLRDLSNDYSTVVTDQGGAYVINPTVCESIEGVVNDDGTKTFTIKVKEGLVYNNGEPINIKDFIWTTAFGCSKLMTDVGAKLTSYLTVVGGQEYYDGTATTISGLRILDDYTMSISIVADKIPYFYDLAYAGVQAFSMKYWLGEGVDVADDGEGVYFTGDNFNLESVQAALDVSRFKAGEDRVSAGPYNLVEYDVAAKQATLTINPNYAGNFEGQKPSIKKIVVLRAEDATWADAIKTGGFNFYDTITDGAQVNTAMDIMEDESVKEKLGYGFQYDQFDRAGYGFLHFSCDFGPTQFVAVRHAIAQLDRNEFANTFCQGWGGVVNSQYGTGLWQYQLAEEWLNENLNSYPYDPDAAVQTLIDDGWVLAEDGSEYKEGIRWKEVTEEQAGTYQYNVKLDDGRILMPLKLDWSSSDGNSVSDLLAVMLANGEQTKAAGIEINQQVMNFTDLLNYYYRDATQGDKYGVPTYCLFNLANNFNPAFDQSYEWTQDPDMIAQGYNVCRLYDPEIDKLSMDMVYGVESGDTDAYMEIWKQYELRWNQQLPQVPLYSNVYITMYPDWLENYDQDSFWDFQQAILYATVAE